MAGGMRCPTCGNIHPGGNGLGELGNSKPVPPDSLTAAQFIVTDLARRCIGGASPPAIKPELALQIAQAGALLDIARTLRSLEGYLCNPSPRAAR